MVAPADNVAREVGASKGDSMSNIGWLALGAGALAAHELVIQLSARHKLPGLPARALRCALLLTTLVATTYAGPAVLARLSELAPAPPVGNSNPSFVPVGDTFRIDALNSQQPQRPFAVGQPAEVTAWRQGVLDALRDQSGITADATTDVPATVVQTQMVGGIKRSLVTFRSWDGALIPAYVHEPQGGGPKAAVLVVAGHGLGIAGTAGLAPDYQHSAALALAQRGYVTLTPELRGFGLLGSEGMPSHRWVAAAALEAGSSYKAVVSRDLSRALTVLEHWPNVDPARLAAAGTSLGGEMAVLLGAVDPRVRVVLSHSYGGSVGPATVDGNRTDDAEQTPHGCHTIPGSNRILHQEDWGRLLAPRPLLVVRGDRNKPAEANRFAEAVRQAYEAHGSSDRFDFAIEAGGHEFYLEPSVRFLSRWL
jgi:dienelactone hydrolase